MSQVNQDLEGVSISTTETATNPGRKIAVLVEGTRGDSQPYVALCKGLQRAGFQVKFFSSRDNVSFVQRFGVDVFGADFSTHEQLTKPNLLEAMSTGDVKKFFKAFEENAPSVRTKELVQSYFAAIEEFCPELILCSPITQTLARAYSFKHGGVPVIMGQLQVMGLTYSTTYFGLPRFGRMLSLLNYGINLMFLNECLKSDLQQFKLISEHVGLDGRIDAKRWLKQELKDPLQLILLGGDASFLAPPKDLVPKVEFCGYWKIDQEMQRDMFEKRDSFFGKGVESNELETFLAAGEAPVYVGWGSMIAVSKEHMMTTAIDALRRAGKRGVVLGGWAQLDTSVLPEELQAYCADNVLVMQTAPHEFLFPRCACVVHHGGAGTTAASVESGVPTIITPVFVDQYDHARLVNEHNIGVGLSQLHKVKPQELADAIVKCCTDEQIRTNAKEMSSKISKDGLEKATERIQLFFREEIDSGRFRSKFEARMKSHLEKRSWWSSGSCSASA